MKLRDSIDNTKVVFYKTLQNLKSFIFVGNQKLPKSASFKLNPFSSCSICSLKNHQTDQYYADFCNELECDLDKAMEMKSDYIVAKEEKEKEEGNSGSTKPLESPLKKKEEKSKYSSNSKRLQDFPKKEVEGGYALAKKMKELEMMDTGDVEHVLDVEEALHYYNRLKSPVYLDIVDQFFTDMYREFSVPQPSARINSSIRL